VLQGEYGHITPEIISTSVLLCEVLFWSKSCSYLSVC